MRPRGVEPFLIGANLPWITYGCDFGASAWFPDGGVSRPGPRGRLERAARFARDAGLHTIRWFLLCDGRSGIRYDGTGTPVGLDDHVRRDMDTALAVLDRHRLRAIFVLFDFHLCRRGRRVNGVRLRGRRGLVRDPGQREALVQRVVIPLVSDYGREAAIDAWDLFNEPEWVTLGMGAWNPLTAVRAAGVRAFLGDVAAAVRTVTDRAITVGLATPRGLELCGGLALDFYQVHWYDALDRRSPLDRPVTALGLDRPVLLGEFPTRSSGRDPAEVLTLARRAGYAGALLWSLAAGDAASDPARAAERVAAWRRGGAGESA